MLLFVVGSLRSGTSLLYALLNQHPAIALMYEPHVLNFRPIVNPHRVRRDWAARLDFWNGAFARHGLDPADFPAVGTAREAAILLYNAFRVRKDALIFGEKAPGYTHRLDAVAQTFPEARFVVIWRDPANIYRSMLRAGASERFFARRGRLSFLLTDLDIFQSSIEQLLASHAPVHQVRYEALVEDPAGSMKAACRFLDIPYVDSMSSLDGADLTMLAPGEHHARLHRLEITKSPHLSSDGISTRARGKIARYQARWSERYPILPHWNTGPGPISGGPPPWWELLSDRAQHHLVLEQSAIARRIFALTPTLLWQTYRSLRSERIPAPVGDD